MIKRCRTAKSKPTLHQPETTPRERKRPTSSLRGARQLQKARDISVALYVSMNLRALRCTRNHRRLSLHRSIFLWRRPGSSPLRRWHHETEVVKKFFLDSAGEDVFFIQENYQCNQTNAVIALVGFIRGNRMQAEIFWGHLEKIEKRQVFSKSWIGARSNPGRRGRPTSRRPGKA